MSKLSGLGFRGISTDADLPNKLVHVMSHRPLQRLLNFCGRSIDDVVNSPLVKNEILGYWKVQRQIHRRSQVLELEKQWNPAGRTE